MALRRVVVVVALMLLATALRAAPLACRPMPGAERALASGLLLLGEIHGTTESPATAARFVCAALQRQRRVVLFLEIPADEQPRLDAYQQSDGGPAAQRALVRASPFWQAPAEAQDGRRSVAMLDLIDTARRWRQSGAALALVAFDADREVEQRDRTMAERVRAIRVRDPGAMLITYTGNIHNMLTPPAGIPAPMGTHLADLRPVSLDLLPEAGGESWACRGSCGIQALYAPPPAMRRALRADRRAAFSDVVSLAPVTASIPAAYRLDAGAAR